MNQIWTKYNKLVEEDREHEALMHLFLDLSRLIKYPDKCDLFIEECISLDLKTVTISHVLNVLSKIQEKLKHWEDFKEYCYIKFKDSGIKDSRKLVNLISGK